MPVGIAAPVFGQLIMTIPISEFLPSSIVSHEADASRLDRHTSLEAPSPAAFPRAAAHVSQSKRHFEVFCEALLDRLGGLGRNLVRHLQKLFVLGRCCFQILAVVHGRNVEVSESDLVSIRSLMDRARSWCSAS